MAELDEGLPSFEVVTDVGQPDLIQLKGELDIAGVDRLRDAFRALPAGVDRVVVDVEGLAFMDSSGIAALLEAVGQGRAVVLRSPSPLVRRVLEATGVASLLGIEP